MMHYVLKPLPTAYIRGLDEKKCFTAVTFIVEQDLCLINFYSFCHVFSSFNVLLVHHRPA